MEMVLAAQEIETRLHCEQRLPVEFTANDPPEPQAYLLQLAAAVAFRFLLTTDTEPKNTKSPSKRPILEKELHKDRSTGSQRGKGLRNCVRRP